ncbi:hypothetical protein PQ455_03355 [Sphingomonas naphthae]|uniref:Uncharacterized protein n=1 Tax=Sphingomonas naphthae TaxID=1813468 RepID=A0ABY7TQ23_9SPHN|nr:hypothetical protein [Sphingomonas naphthae]WCT74279.1 hypothetical protein PQ455_03355 [Sphingomonas naphthae]
MIDQLDAVKSDLEAALDELTRGAAGTGDVKAQLQGLTQLQRQIGGADATALTALKRDVAAAVALGQNAVQEARVTANLARTSDGERVADLAADSRAQVSSLMRDMHQFDEELEFASEQERAAYRQREAERRAYIAAEQAKGTPEGDLNAAGGAVGQMADAAAHGASSPEFQKRWDALADSTQKLRAAIIRDGGDVSKFDDRLRDDLRRILKSKGLTDAQIDAKLAEHPDNPLEAVKAYVASTEVTALERSAQRATTVAYIATPPARIVSPEFSGLDELAEFRAAGITLSDHNAAEPFAHGVTAREVAVASTNRTPAG